MKLVVPFKFIMMLILISHLSKAEGSSNGASTVNNFYTFHDVSSTWEEAREACNDMEAHLVTMETTEEWNNVKSLIAEKVKKNGSYTHWYIGLRKTGGTWKWTEAGSPGITVGTDDSRWRDLQPSPTASETCGEIWYPVNLKNPGRFNNIKCNAKDYKCPRGYICEQPYTFHDVSSTWEEARDACNDMGAHLVTMETTEEWNKVKSFIAEKVKKNGSYTHWYIGLRKTGGTWKWTEAGSPGITVGTDDSRWRDLQPSPTASETCGEIWYPVNLKNPGRFNNIKCNSKEYKCPRGYICENF